MSFIDILADVSGVVKQLKRIADALDRISPVPVPRAAVHASERGQGAQQQSDSDGFHMAESPEEYQARLTHESDLAISLGVAPWSPAFQEAILQMKSDIMKPRVEVSYDEAGARVEVEHTYSEAEAEDILRQSFKLAQASATLSKSEG